ncbi:MAG: polysulfide reductase NrfD [Thermoleophilaceae bacterium]
MSGGKGQPPEDVTRELYDAQAHAGTRDMAPAVGRRGGPGPYGRGVEGAGVAFHRRAWQDSRWSYLFKRGDTDYAIRVTTEGARRVAGWAQRMRGGTEPGPGLHGPMMHPAVWTWEVPLYFWFGGMASGSSFIALACDLSGDRRAARTARLVTLATIIPAPPLLIMDLGRPERFLNMLRIFKPRSPMSMGAWCLNGFSGLATAAVAADLLGRDRTARAAGGATAAVGTYLGSYTGVLLAATAVPVWARSRLYLPPIFICTATATGAAANRLVLAATGTRVGDPTRTALGTVETTAMAAELALSSFNEKRLGKVGDALSDGDAGRLFNLAKWSVRLGLALRFARKRGGPWTHHLASCLYLLGGLAFRFAWVSAGSASATDDEIVARTARTAPATFGREKV